MTSPDQSVCWHAMMCAPVDCGRTGPWAAHAPKPMTASATAASVQQTNLQRRLNVLQAISGMCARCSLQIWHLTCSGAGTLPVSPYVGARDRLPGGSSMLHSHGLALGAWQVLGSVTCCEPWHGAHAVAGNAVKLTAACHGRVGCARLT
jgi:hypothetical protein